MKNGVFARLWPGGPCWRAAHHGLPDQVGQWRTERRDDRAVAAASRQSAPGRPNIAKAPSGAY